MSEKTTENLPDGRSFEERVFARLDAIDGRFDSVDRRFDSVDRRLDTVDRRLDTVDRRLDTVDRRLDSVDGRLNAVDGRLNAVDGRLDSIDGRLRSLESQAERRALETKPIWERALAEILEVKEHLSALEQSSNQIVRKIDVLGKDMLTMRADQTGLEYRLDKLESKPVS